MRLWFASCFELRRLFITSNWAFGGHILHNKSPNFHLNSDHFKNLTSVNETPRSSPGKKTSLFQFIPSFVHREKSWIVLIFISWLSLHLFKDPFVDSITRRVMHSTAKGHLLLRHASSFDKTALSDSPDMRTGRSKSLCGIQWAIYLHPQKDAKNCLPPSFALKSIPPFRYMLAF